MAADSTPGRRSAAREQRAIERVLFAKVRPAAKIDRIARRGQLELRLQDAVRLKAGIHRLQLPEALDQQPGAAHEQQRERELGHDECLLQTSALRLTRRRAVVASLQTVLDR